MNEPDYHRCHVEANTWIKVGLSKGQARRLKEFAKSKFRSKKTSAAGAWYLINLALDNLPVMEALLKAPADLDVLPSCGLEKMWEASARALRKGRN